MLKRQSRKSRVRHQRPAHLCIRHLRLKDFPEPIARSHHRYVKAIEPSVNDAAGIVSGQRLAYGSRVRRYTYECEQCLSRKGDRLFGIERSVEPRAAS